MSTQKAASVRLAELEAEGVEVEPVWGNDYRLTVDLDTPEARVEFPRRFAALIQYVPGLTIVKQWPSRGGVGEHVHIVSGHRLGFQTRAAYQAFLGSDPLREMLGYFDVNNAMEEDPFVLFKPAEVICQDCGEKALNGYVAGDLCERMAKRNACVPETVCGGRLDGPRTT